MKRLFIAIRIPDPLRHRIYADAVGLMRKAHKGRLLDPDSYHITMAFLGAVADDRMDSIKAVMDRSKVRDFNMTLMGFSSFKGDKGNLLFREVDGERILYNLQEKLVRLLRREGFILSEQKFIPHITVGRRVYGLSKDMLRAWEAEHIDVSVNAKKVSKIEKAEKTEKPEKTEKAQDKLNAQCKKLEEAAEQYIFEYFDEKFTEKYGQELQALEEKVITGFDKYLEYNISEKINEKLITKTAMTETYAPIIEGIQHLFEDQYVPMDLTGSKKLREAKAENAELQKSLKKQLAENMRLIDLVEDSNKKATIAEKTAGLDANQKARVQKFFESKSFSETKKDIEDYVDMISEQSINMRNNRTNLFEKKARPVSRTAKIEKSLERDEVITERYKKQSPTNTFLGNAARYMDED